MAPLTPLDQLTDVRTRGGQVMLTVRGSRGGASIRLSVEDVGILASRLAAQAEKLRHDILFAREDSQK